MNTLAGHATAFPDDTVRMAGPATTGPAFMEWARDNAPGLARWQHPPRALMGRYLAWAHERITGTAAPTVRIVRHPTLAAALDEAPEGRLRLRSPTGRPAADAVVLATGHTDQRPTPEELELTAAAGRYGLRHLPPGHAHEARLDSLPPGEPVLVRGLALNFFDQLALLTAGRGGRFEPDGRDGRLRYLPSGREPRILAGSGRGVPYLARHQAPGRTPTGHRLRFFDEAAVERLTAREPGTVGFMAEVWPLIAKEAGAAWYGRLLAVRPDAVRLPADVFLHGTRRPATGRMRGLNSSRRAPQTPPTASIRSHSTGLWRAGCSPTGRNSGRGHGPGCATTWQRPARRSGDRWGPPPPRSPR